MGLFREVAKLEDRDMVMLRDLEGTGHVYATAGRHLTAKEINTLHGKIRARNIRIGELEAENERLRERAREIDPEGFGPTAPVG